MYLSPIQFKRQGAAANERGPKGCGCAAVNVAPPAPDATGVDLKRLRYRVGSMDCPTEEALVCGRLAALPGMVKLEFNLARRSLTVNHRLPSPALIEQALSATGMQTVRAGETRFAQNTVLTIRQMDCSTGEVLIRGRLTGVPGVVGLDFNLVQHTLAACHAARTLPQVLAAIQSLGFDTEVRDTSVTASASVPDTAPIK